MTMHDTVSSNVKTDKWQRLAPASIIYFIVQFLVTSIKQGVQGLAPLAAIIFTAGENRWFVIGLIAAALVVLLMVGAFLSYIKFRFRISGNTFLIQRGVFTRKRLTLSFDRIQNVSFKEPIYFRPFNLVILAIESAGSSDKEVSLGGIPRSLAEAIRSTVLNLKAAPQQLSVEKTETTSENSADTDKPTDIIRQPIGELVRYGLSNNNIWVFAGIATGTIAQIEWDEIAFGIAVKDTVENAIGNSGALMAAFVSTVALFIFILLLATSVLAAIIVYYNYHLTRHDGRFHRSKGLLERQEASLLESKIQSLVINQPWPAKLLHRFHVTPKQVGFSKHGNAGNAGNSGAVNFLIPSVKEAFTKSFSKLLYPNFDWASLRLKPIHKIYILKMIVLFYLPISLLVSASITYSQGVYGLIPFILPIIAFPFVSLRHARYGYNFDENHGIVRSGFIGHKLTIFPFYKVQTVSVIQTPGQRKRGLADLSISLAGTSLYIPYIPLADAQKWKDRILMRIETSKKPWM